jgi:hypothetical protein
MEMLRKEAEMPRALARRPRVQRAAQQPHLSRPRPQQSRQQLQQGGLAGAVRPDDAQDLARMQRERHAVQQVAAAGTEAQPLGAQDRLSHAGPRAPG